eukprot:9130092-Lingulodinium_polyedra.AAC.1
MAHGGRRSRAPGPAAAVGQARQAPGAGDRGSGGSSGGWRDCAMRGARAQGETIAAASARGRA